MASPASGGGSRRMPRQPKLKPPKVQPIKPKLPGAEQPYPMPRIIDDTVSIQPFPGPGPYSPIKQTKSVNKVYKTY